MLIPVGTDNPIRRRPIANYVLLALNVIIFIYTYSPHPIYPGSPYSEPLREQVSNLKLNPLQPEIYQFITYAFLHGGWMHLIGNMIFLLIFGNNVNDKLGQLGYVLLYLGGAVASGLGHALFNTTPVLGASGAIACVTGAYMVLFPKTYIRVFYIIFFIGVTELPALYFILFKLIFYDNVIEPRLSGGGNVAHGAHLAGYLFGVMVPLVMLALHLLPHSQYDLWALVRRWHRRWTYRQTVSNGYDPYSPTGAVGIGRKKVDAKVVDLDDPAQQKIMRLRGEISAFMQASNLAAAADTYLQMVELDSAQILPQQLQLEIANKLMQTGRHSQAAAAYENFLARYTNYQFIEQIQLMLGLLYSRYLNQPQPAQKYLTAALQKLSDPGQKQMCQNELDRIEGTL
ncbi:MAG: rhomboid family intramembrane serine protease [Sedimentisphaerales bacterium]|nr:rhomboid family intramembrane serine protease [Sedimentisphaerales bacterium]